MLKELLRDDNEFNSVLCPQAKHKTPTFCICVDAYWRKLTIQSFNTTLFDMDVFLQRLDPKRDVFLQRLDPKRADLAAHCKNG